ncbi:FAD-dependent oxidoreductase [Lentibacillus sp. N15]|uniref:FAD-dependent oxidoreductase n=1 Tax=Lentibacillus songyuanensis TaxID=3136161 RepID=UPI0031BB9D60
MKNEPSIREQNEKTTCCIVGGGPAGVITGLLLARQGVDVTVLEKHEDFLRDFRGDTIHPSTLELLVELGWIDEFLRLPHAKMRQVTVEMAGTPVTFADFHRLKVSCPYIAFMPQWDFLNFITEKAHAYSNFQLMMNTEATELISDGDRTVGVLAYTQDGQQIKIRADLVIGADGRHSIVRSNADLKVIEKSPPMDVLWFRLSRKEGEEFPFFRPGRGYVLICINRGDYWQMAYVIPNGQYDTVKAEGLNAFQSNIKELFPQLDDRLKMELNDWDDVKFLKVSVDRLERWFSEGLLCIGDAAHAMSPAGGVGINLAIQDGVATANILGPILKKGKTPSIHDLKLVQRRRKFPMRVTQAFQVHALSGLYPKNLHDDPSRKMPLVFKLFKKIPQLRYLMGRIVGIGVRPEHIRE